jgi:hypothetical protein
MTDDAPQPQPRSHGDSQRHPHDLALGFHPHLVYLHLLRVQPASLNQGLVNLTTMGAGCLLPVRYRALINVIGGDEA